MSRSTSRSGMASSASPTADSSGRRTGWPSDNDGLVVGVACRDIALDSGSRADGEALGSRCDLERLSELAVV